jgi:hypothetical protein
MSIRYYIVRDTSTKQFFIYKRSFDAGYPKHDCTVLYSVGDYYKTYTENKKFTMDKNIVLGKKIKKEDIGVELI